ncbi:MAG: metallophosphoesterase [Anaerolineae bacterium]|nr:metallophosphoesterase [Anaerolineae bacterium]
MVKILCVSDTIVSQLENAANLRRRYNDIDLVVSCGDLSAAYLEFITSVLNVPLFYVRGNHDLGYDDRPPGGENLHGKVRKFRGLTFFGLEGSMRYNNADIQYSDGEMTTMVMRMAPRLGYRRWRYGHAIDIFVAHSPPFGIHDAKDLPHHGFKSFLNFLDWYRPRYMVHGHIHTYDRRVTTVTDYLDTRIMNINPYTILEIEPEV